MTIELLSRVYTPEKSVERKNLTILIGRKKSVDRLFRSINTALVKSVDSLEHRINNKH